MSSLARSNEEKDLETKSGTGPSSPISDRKCPPIGFDGFTPAKGRPSSGPLKKRIKDRCSLDSSYSLPFTPSGFFDITPNVASQKKESSSSSTRNMEVPRFRMPMKDLSTNTPSKTYIKAKSIENRASFPSGRDDAKKLAFSPANARNPNKVRSTMIHHNSARDAPRLVGPVREQPKFLLPRHSPIASKASNDFTRSLERSNASLDHKNTYMGLMRQQLEFFEISPEEVAFCKTKNVAVQVGQVALRCKHCTCVSIELRQRGSMIVAMEHNSLYKHFFHGKNVHIEELCPFVKDATQEQLKALRQQRGATDAQDQFYWSSVAKKEGVVETPAGLRFKSSLLIAKNSNLGLRKATNAAPSKKKKRRRTPIEFKIDDGAPSKKPASAVDHPQAKPTTWLESMSAWHIRFQEFVYFKIKNGHGKWYKFLDDTT